MASTENVETNTLSIKNEPAEEETIEEEQNLSESAQVVVVKQEPAGTSNSTTTIAEIPIDNRELDTNILDDIGSQLDEAINSLRAEEEEEEQPVVSSVKKEPAAAIENADEEESFAELTPNFFDDILPPEENTQPLEDLPEEELERKYSERLREFIALDGTESTGGTAQKRASETANDVPSKRARPINESRPHIRCLTTSELSNEEAITRTPHGPVYLKSEHNDDETPQSNIECLQVHHNNTRSNEQVNSQIRATPVDASRIKVENVFAKYEDVGSGVDVPAELKRENAKNRVLAAIHLFRNMMFGQVSLLHTDTVRKLPTSAKYLSQQYFENRSQLHTNNVPFAYSTPGKNINLSDWGLEPLTPSIAKITKVLGYDVHVLYYKTKLASKPIYLPRNETEKEIVVENLSTFHSTKATQTNISGPVTKQKPIIKKLNTGIQTDLPSASNALNSCVRQFPHLKKMDRLNNNQLLALNDFVELMQQDDIAADVYRLRECLLQIYNRSRMPIMQNVPMYLPTDANIPNFFSQQPQQQQMFSHQQQQHQEFFPPQQHQQQQNNWQQNRGVSRQDPRRRNNPNMTFNN